MTSDTTTRPAPPGPDSVSWRIFGDRRVLLLAGRALLLQVMHPVVGAGVTRHSDYAADPVGRLRRTLSFVNAVVYGTREAAEAQRMHLQRVHHGIEGVDERGRPYSSSDPEAFHWVHATLVETAVTMRQHFGRPLTAPETDRLYAEWCDVGRIIGVRPQDMPATWAEFGPYFDHMVHERLEATPAARQLLVDIAAGIPLSGLRAISPPHQAVVRLESHVSLLVAAGTLPPVLRQRLGLRWTPAHQAELTALERTVRVGVGLAPVPLRYRPGPRAAWQAAGWPRSA